MTGRQGRHSPHLGRKRQRTELPSKDSGACITIAIYTIRLCMQGMLFVQQQATTTCHIGFCDQHACVASAGMSSWCCSLWPQRDAKIHKSPVHLCHFWPCQHNLCPYHRQRQKEKREDVQRQLQILSRRLESLELQHKSLNERNRLLERLVTIKDSKAASLMEVSHPRFVVHISQRAPLLVAGLQGHLKRTFSQFGKVHHADVGHGCPSSCPPTVGVLYKMRSHVCVH